MWLFPKKAHHLFFWCAFTVVITSLVSESWSAPPFQESKQQASSRVWANYARQMEPQRRSVAPRLSNEHASPLSPTSWIEAIEEDSLTIQEQTAVLDGDQGSCQGCVAGCCPSHQRSCQRWIQIDYLLGWRKGQRIPELVTTSVAGTARTEAGELGLPTTSIVLGNEDLVDGARPGGRIDFGRWLANGETAVAGRFYGLSDTSTNHFFDQTTHDILARPFFHVINAEEDALPINFPAVDTGSIQVTSGASLIGSDFYLRQSWCQLGNACVDLITGYQFTRIDEKLHIESTSTNQAVQSIEVVDQFDTRNVFHGGLLGLISEVDGSCWSLSMLAKVGLGNTHETVRVNGTTLITDLSGSTIPFSNGLLAQPSNIGIHTANEFTVVPELNIRYTRHLTDCIDLAIGYTGIYWSEAAQPGNQVNLNIDPGGGTQPLLNMVSDDYWLQSLDLGITWWF